MEEKDYKTQDKEFSELEVGDFVFKLIPSFILLGKNPFMKFKVSSVDDGVKDNSRKINITNMKTLYYSYKNDSNSKHINDKNNYYYSSYDELITTLIIMRDKLNKHIGDYNVI